MRIENYPEKTCKILMIDYDSSPRLKRIAESIGYCKVIPMHNQKKACDFFFNHSIDLVLLDHQPKKPCIEPLKFFKSVKPTIPVIVSTAFGSEDLAVKVFRIGARDYLKKPLTAEEFKRSLDSALGIRHIFNNNHANDYLNGIGKAINLIHRHYATRIDMAHAAREAGMSISSFVRVFKKETGINFTLYVNRLRIAKAVKMLKDDDISMRELAAACGFTNQFHFSRTFKKIMEHTPSEYKKSIVQG
jgi:YesN/AraC family two-component response regulator